MPRRLFQDTHFELPGLRGTVLAELRGVCSGTNRFEPALVLLKPAVHVWQRFFLDAGFAVWEEVPNLELSEYDADSGYTAVDYAAHFHLVGATILEVRATPGGSASSCIQLRVPTGTFLVASSEPDRLDSRSRASFVSSQTLDELDPPAWGDADHNAGVVGTCHRLRKKPLDAYSVEDLRIMIGQNIGVQFLLPLAVAILECEPLVKGDLYAGDLLAVTLAVPDAHWSAAPHLRSWLSEALVRVTDPPNSLRAAIEEFLLARTA
jgi:hypothetical protein